MGARAFCPEENEPVQLRMERQEVRAPSLTPRDHLLLGIWASAHPRAQFCPQVTHRAAVPRHPEQAGGSLLIFDQSWLWPAQMSQA